jgi:bifunctional UDP-N-acetylglucosamine pyrophosphorylase/glucosamine-1-phosphate N-acetyltransferase
MRSSRIKILHEVAGRPMGAWVLEAARALSPSRVVMVVGHQADAVRAAFAGLVDAFVVQAEQLGTGHAVLQAASELRGRAAGTLLILNGDLPSLRPATLRAFVAAHRRNGSDLSVLTTTVDDPSGYGRIVRGRGAALERIVEHRDADTAVRRIHEINAGIYCARTAVLLPALRRLKPRNAQGEYYLTDAFARLTAAGKKVGAVRHAGAAEVLGVNTRAELARAARDLYARKAATLQDAGVTVLDPATTRVDPRARIGRDSVLHPGVLIEGACVLGEGCVVRSGCRLTDVAAGRGVEFRDHSVVQDSRIDDGAAVGPFAHVRPGSILGRDVRVGNFVELKKAHLGRGTKASHLSYLGDAEIGEGCNIGAGTITCNYDGERKNPTRLARGVFIGSDTQLVAPVAVGEGAYVAAGTTVTQDVPAGALAIGRCEQKNVLGWVERRKAKRQPGR